MPYPPSSSSASTDNANDDFATQKERRRDQNRLSSLRYRAKIRAARKLYRSQPPQFEPPSSTDLALPWTSRSLASKPTTGGDAANFYRKLASQLGLEAHEYEDDQSYLESPPIYPFESSWTERLLRPRWDLVKVFNIVAHRFGLSDAYINDEGAISQLADNYFRHERIQSQDVVVTARKQCNLGPTSEEWKDVPKNFHPVMIGSTIKHHPYIDLAFPWPLMRSRILICIGMGRLCQDQLCKDIWPGDEYCSLSEEPPYQVHGDDPFDCEAYEVSERFARKYPFLMDESIIRRTNWWRRQKGMAELRLRNIGLNVVEEIS